MSTSYESGESSTGPQPTRAPDAAPGYDTTEGRVFTVSGGDWDTITLDPSLANERIVVNMGPQHPSTHGVLRLILELEGESVQRPAAASATCTPASRRTWSTATGPRAQPS